MLQADTQSLLDYLTPARIVFVALTIVAAWVAIRSARFGLALLGNRVRRARFFFKRLEPFVSTGIWFVAAFLILSTLSPTRDTFLAGIGSIAIALGLGAQDLIKNVIGGIVLLADQPFQLGDRVRIGNAFGEIVRIGLHSITLTTTDDARVTVPNAAVLTGQIANTNSGVPEGQVVTELILPFHVDAERALRIGREAALASPYLLLRKPVVCLISDEIRDQPYVLLKIKAYVHDHRFEPHMKSDITIRARRHFARRGLVTPAPESGSGGNPAQESGAHP